MSRIVATLVLSVVASLGFAGTVHAQSPLNRLSIFKHIEAEEGVEYRLGENNGPWLILCSSFVGDEGKRQANQLVLELRREFKLHAFVHEMNWDFSEKISGRGFDKYGRPKTMEHANYEKRLETAVLVGNFSSIDDPEGQRTLEKIRYIKPLCLDPEYIAQNGQKNTRAFAGWRQMSAQLLSKDEDLKRRGPLGKAFMVSNPMIAQEYFRPKGVDPLVEKLNEPLEHSLLKCPGKYTVKVATFTGAAAINPKDVEAVAQGRKKLVSRLEQAAMDAHNMTLALRAKNYEAYEYHDQTKSIVTIGSFASFSTTRPDGKLEYDPEVRKIVDAFGATQENVGGKTSYVPKRILGILFDVEPEPIEVPQRSIAVAYER